MIVYIAFEFEGVDPNDKDGDDILELMSSECEYLCDKFGATAVWIDDAQGEEK